MVTLHSAVPYQSDDPTDYKWTVLAHTSMLNGSSTADIRQVGLAREARFVGPCPCCLKTFTWTRTLDAVVGAGGPLGDADPTVDPYEPLDIRCECGVHHTGSEIGVTGCGVVFRVSAKRTLDA